MTKISTYSFLAILLFFAACSGIATYDDNEAAAIVRGEEITVGELRFLYPDDTALDYLKWLIEVKLAKQEVINMGLDISGNLDDDNVFGELPPENSTDSNEKQIRKFAESQAKKFDMTPEEFQKEYAQTLDENNAYVVTYLEEKLGKLDFEDEQEMNEFNEKSTNLFDELVEENEAEIKILIE